jgi:hypothetical protein
MDIEWRLLLPLLGLVLLAILITGPGMWSDRWGYWWVHRDEPRSRRRR